jgi:hypothetical protein
MQRGKRSRGTRLFSRGSRSVSGATSGEVGKHTVLQGELFGHFLANEVDVAQLYLDDHSPGAPLETRKLPGGALVLVMRIVGDPQMDAKVELVLRCEPDGQVLSAISRRVTDETE